MSEHDGWGSCLWCGQTCEPDAQCDCCEIASLRAEVEKLTADRDKWKARAYLPLHERDGLRIEVHRLKDDLADREAAIQRVREVAAACYANDRYNASLAAVMRALDGGESDE